MTDTPPDHEVLARLNAEISRETDRIADLQNRIRVIEIEVADWKMPPDPPRSSGRDLTFASTAFFAALAVTSLLGSVVGAVFGR